MIAEHTLNSSDLVLASFFSFNRLTNDFVAERIGHSNFLDVRELDFPSCSVRTVDLGTGDTFKNLRR